MLTSIRETGPESRLGSHGLRVRFGMADSLAFMGFLNEDRFCRYGVEKSLHANPVIAKANVIYELMMTRVN
jgi:hypothetical protein